MGIVVVKRLPVRSFALNDEIFGILLWNLFEFKGFERVFLSSGFHKLANSGVDLYIFKRGGTCCVVGTGMSCFRYIPSYGSA